MRAGLLRRPRTWLIAVPVLALLVAVVGPYVYLNFVQDDPPPPLTLSDSNQRPGTGMTPSTGQLGGTWTVSQGSHAGYRVREVLFGQDTEAVGRTTAVTGTATIDGTTVTAATFTVDMTKVQSDEDRRDNQFHRRIMDTATYPTATFTLSQPVSLTTVTAGGEQVTARVTGQFTIRGRTRTVTFDARARRDGDRVEVNGAIPFEFADYGIPDASFGPATVQDRGQIEFLLVLARA